jgi:hypothetical protein
LLFGNLPDGLDSRRSSHCAAGGRRSALQGIESFKMTPADDHLNDLRKDEWRSMGFQQPEELAPIYVLSRQAVAAPIRLKSPWVG